jgi:hypothetical protein
VRLPIILYAIAWVLVILEPALWPVALLGFAQNLSHTFVSRGRNSGSLGYHMLASIFSNGIYISLLVLSISLVSYMETSDLPVFVLVYVLSTMSGSVTAHGLALRFERGKSRNVQEDRVTKIELEVKELRAKVGLPVEVKDDLCTYALVGRCSQKAEVEENESRIKDTRQNLGLLSELVDQISKDFYGDVPDGLKQDDGTPDSRLERLAAAEAKIKELDAWILEVARLTKEGFLKLSGRPVTIMTPVADGNDVVGYLETEEGEEAVLDAIKRDPMLAKDMLKPTVDVLSPAEITKKVRELEELLDRSYGRPGNVNEIHRVKRRLDRLAERVKNLEKEDT